MAYNGGCLIGTKARENSAPKYTSRNTSISGVTVSTLNSETTTATPDWTAGDGAWTPGQNCERSHSSGLQYTGCYMTMPNVLQLKSNWGILCGYETQLTANAYNVNYFYTAPSGGSFAATTAPTKLDVKPILGSSTSHIIALDYPTSAVSVALQMARSYAGTVSGCIWTECYGAYLQELPYNQELVSYRRIRTAPSSTTIKTLDGAIRKVATGLAATSVSTTFKWSDDGTIAEAVSDILRAAADNLTPLILYVPQAVYYGGACLDLIHPSSDPTITMPAPGVYELTIEGTCQP